MTYVSRRARITVPRWPNDFDPEFLFRVGRRCDGRLKRHSSCLDLRAWINDNCIKNEYLLDLMSDGEVTIKPPLQLYGRFIPVPLLFKLLQNSRSENGAYNNEQVTHRSLEEDNDAEKINKALHWATDGQKQKSKEPGLSDEENRKAKALGTAFAKRTGSGAFQLDEEEKETGAGKVKWKPPERKEYYVSEYDSTGALADDVDPRMTSTESTIFIDDDSENKNKSHRSGSEGSLAKVLWEKDLAEKNLFKSTCLLTKALGKLEKIDNIIQVANEEREKMRKGEIREAFHKPILNCIYLTCKRGSEKSPNAGVKYRVRSPGDLERQTTLKCNELLRQISGLREKLKKNQECQQKVNEEIAMSQKEAESGTSPYMTELETEEGEAQMRKLQKRLERLINHRGKLLSDMCQALTQLNNLKRCRNSRVDLRQRSRSGENRSPNYSQEKCTCNCRKCQSSESEKVHVSDSGSSTDNRRPDVNFNPDNKYYEYSSTDNLDSGKQNSNDENPTKPADTLNETYTSNAEGYNDNSQEKERRKAILRFCCSNPPCREELEKYLRPCQQRPNSRGPLPANLAYRPSTSPTTQKEKQDASDERQFYPYRTNSQEIPERRVKSETTMKEIEKTLRNYEQRLNDMDGLECKVEEWKRKLLEACRWKKNASKVEEQMKKEQEDERDKASMEINGLFSQNYELKKQVRQLTDKSKEQAKKIQNMKSSILKARELETETEELKKELSEYRNSYEHQRKCISKWESVVALQRKEIENLMNHIRKLTTEKKEQVSVVCQERKCIQRTRSCSPVTLVDCQNFCRPETWNPRSDEENGSCCCQDFRQSDSRRNHLRFFDKNYYSSANDREDWCT